MGGARTGPHWMDGASDGDASTDTASLQSSANNHRRAAIAYPGARPVDRVSRIRAEWTMNTSPKILEGRGFSWDFERMNTHFSILLVRSWAR